MQQLRTETDSLGEKSLPDQVYYGIQTERAKENFADVSGRTLGQYPEFVYAIAAIKQAAARANCTAGAVSAEVCGAICTAAQEIMDGKMQDQFPEDILQGGGGTSANMNVNEVIANRANELLTGEKGYTLVHPNTHVNKGQSTNDVIPAAMKIACYGYLDGLAQSTEYLAEALREKQREFQNVVKMGRTCMQDALPVTLGQEFSGYVSVLERRRKNLLELRDQCGKLPLGGTAVGTKVSVWPGYLTEVYQELSRILGRTVERDENLFDGLQNADCYIDISAGVKALACAVSKVATDLRLLSSGPNVGIMELRLPAVQPGSSIMPGKVNPVMPELMNQLCYQVCGNDVAVTMACEGGELDLNVWEPVIIKCLGESARLLTKGLRLFADRCVKGIEANAEHCRAGSDQSIALSTVIATLFDYPTGSRIAKLAATQGITIKEACLREKLLTPEQADVLLDPMLLTDGEKFAEKIAGYRGKL